MGSKTTYSPQVAQKICAELSKGIPLAVICREKGMPAVRTVSDWKAEHKEFAADFARARDEGYDALAAGCLEIAEADITVKTAKRGQLPVTASDEIAHRKVKIETRLKLLARWDPKRYGDRKAVDLTVNDSLAERLGRAKARKAGAQE
ncbi:MAG: terminase [Acidovorax sp.]|jgi:hypothetical protein|nr:terminase [Acidovorax sp.]